MGLKLTRTTILFLSDIKSDVIHMGWTLTSEACPPQPRQSSNSLEIGTSRARAKRSILSREMFLTCRST